MEETWFGVSRTINPIQRQMRINNKSGEAEVTLPQKE